MATGSDFKRLGLAAVAVTVLGSGGTTAAVAAAPHLAAPHRAKPPAGHAPNRVFGDGVWAVLLSRGNPRTPGQAIAWARRQAATGSGGWHDRCLNFVAQAYGWNYSGTAYAVDHYRQAIPGRLRHDRDRNPPVGALLFWATGHRAGHVALYVGGGRIASNDIVTDGRISIVAATAPETRWGARYVGWAPPYFPAGG